MGEGKQGGSSRKLGFESTLGTGLPPTWGEAGWKERSLWIGWPTFVLRASACGLGARSEHPKEEQVGSRIAGMRNEILMGVAGSSPDAPLLLWKHRLLAGCGRSLAVGSHEVSCMCTLLPL